MSEVVEREHVAQLKPLLCSIDAACAMIGRGPTFVYDAIATGLLEGVKSDKRTLVRVASLERYAASLPPAKLKRDNRERRRYRGVTTLPAGKARRTG